MRAGAADVAVERQAGGFGGGLRHSQRDTQDRVGTETLLVGGAVELDHRAIDLYLAFGLHAADRLEQFAVHRLDGAFHALTEIALAAIAQFDRLVGARGRAGRHRRAAHRSVFEDDIHFDSRIAPAVEDLASDNVDDGGHGKAPSMRRANSRLS